jgi:TetR/AcrR family transcriptional regulator, mexJK operon transcriptional repressor
LTPSYIALHRMLVAEAPRFPDLAREIYHGGPARGVSELALYLAQEDRKGTLAVADPALAAEQFFGALYGHLQLRALLSPDEAPGEAEIERAIGHAVQGFLRAQAAP